MLTSVQWNVDAHVTAQLVGPHAGRGDHVLGVDGSLIGVDADRPAIGGADAFDGHAFEDPGAPLLGHVGHGHGGVHWRGLTVSGQPDTSHDAVGVQQRIAGAQVVGGDDFHLDAERVGHAGAPHQLLHAFRVVGHAERSDLLEAGGMSHVALEGLVQLGGVGGQPGHVLGGPEAAHEARGVPGGATGQRVAFQQDDVGPAQLSEVVGDAGTHDAATDDDDLSPLGDLLGHVEGLRGSRVAGASARLGVVGPGPCC